MVTLYSLDSGSWKTYASSFVVRDGDHTLHWQSIDAAGRIESMKSASVRVDLNAPILGSPSPTGRVTQSDVTISWAASDNASGIARAEVSLDGGPFESVGIATSITRRLSNGPHDVQVRAFDNVGRQSTSSGHFVVDSSSSSSLPELPLGISWPFLLFVVVLAVVSFVLIGRGHRRRPRTRPKAPTQMQRYEEEVEEETESWDQ